MAMAASGGGAANTHAPLSRSLPSQASSAADWSPCDSQQTVTHPDAPRLAWATIVSMYTLDLVLTTAGVVHPILADGPMPARDLAEALGGERLFIQAFPREDEARQALEMARRIIARLAEARLLAATPGPALDAPKPGAAKP